MSNGSNYHYFTKNGVNIRELVNGVGIEIEYAGEWTPLKTEGMNRDRAGVLLTETLARLEAGDGIF